ncbi:MAG: signal recognition particle-docking protein FtsY [Leptolyngbya sp. PLA2]|nr:signal recognition particle-docking protein FtsY [Leptolyngbya sp.]MCE7972249.1 signal recognition particle-docking protein FtsY [Leptolyngbya sp. PL-A2]MCQ3941171.1 signal recognition particle-docking protein FtsY [cyanobacterium CYA1]MCZ7633240.1 signal recognition particle-docking protein FtsY [Phycisphaerales bacterium]MDL1905455.1 signal recognition particle-docking protein FtsY [Synechococcales cyanobacterium CNB]GIK18285.1 MAG: signal recognition particle-docking protein FtsY [Planct
MRLLKSAISKFRKGLERTRESFVSGLRSVLLGRRLDEGLIREIEARLIRGDVGVRTTRRLIDGIRADFRAGKMSRGEDALDYLKREIAAMWTEEDRRLRFAPAGQGPTVVLVTGVNGVGKTTSIAKLCALLRADGKRVLLGACDTFRAGATRQLEIWAERLGVEVVKGQQGGDPAAVAFDACAAAKARGVDVLILDTAGRLHTQDPLMRQLEKIRKVVEKQIPGGPHETLLVLDATSGQNALRQAEEFTRAVGVTGIFLAKLDGTAKGGVVVAIRETTDVPVKFVGVGETPEDVEPFDPRAFVEALFAE